MASNAAVGAVAEGYHVRWEGTVSILSFNLKRAALKGLRGALVYLGCGFEACTVMIGVEVIQYIHVVLIRFTVKPPVLDSMTMRHGSGTTTVNRRLTGKRRQTKCWLCP